MLLGSGGGRFVRLWRCCLLSVPLGEQASGRRWDCSGLKGASAPNGTMKCRGHGVPEMVTPAMRTTAVLLGFLNLTNMFSFAMTSSLASDSDKFKIIITLRRAQKFGDTGPYKNFDFLFNRLPAAMKCRGHGVPEMVTPAMRTTAVLLGF